LDGTWPRLCIMLRTARDTATNDIPAIHSVYTCNSRDSFFILCLLHTQKGTRSESPRMRETQGNAVRCSALEEQASAQGNGHRVGRRPTHPNGHLQPDPKSIGTRSLQNPNPFQTLQKRGHHTVAPHTLPPCGGWGRAPKRKHNRRRPVMQTSAAATAVAAAEWPRNSPGQRAVGCAGFTEIVGTVLPAKQATHRRPV
jgi:hypothetical protein